MLVKSIKYNLLVSSAVEYASITIHNCQNILFGHTAFVFLESTPLLYLATHTSALGLLPKSDVIENICLHNQLHLGN